jgi:hypothetical protein
LNFGFPGYSHCTVITASKLYGYSFRTKFYSISNNVIDTCGWSCSCSVCKHPFRFIKYCPALAVRPTISACIMELFKHTLLSLPI